MSKQCIWASALTLTALCAQISTVIMATASQDKAQWNEAEAVTLVDFLLMHKSEIGDAGMFKMTTFNAAAEHIAENHSLGPAKTGKMFKTKW